MRSFLLQFNKTGDSLEYADDSLKGDREVVLAAVQQNGCSLEHADDSLKGDREIRCLLLVQQMKSWDSRIELR